MAVTSDTGDTADEGGLNALCDWHTIGSIIRLAGLQVPFSKANSPLGARVNLEGMINILEDAPIRVHLG
ncbi:MAG: hypothetical protein ACPG61_07785 [Paracoccaceae bacterium]